MALLNRNKKLSLSHPKVIEITRGLRSLGALSQEDIKLLNSVKRVLAFHDLVEQHQKLTGDQLVDVNVETIGLQRTSGCTLGEFSARLFNDGRIEVYKK
jgi:hypothetical protein